LLINGWDELRGLFYLNVLLNHRYTITVTPFNSEDVAGPSSVAIELTIIAGGLPLPDPPNSVEVKSNDRQIHLSWNKSSNTFCVSI